MYRELTKKKLLFNSNKKQFKLNSILENSFYSMKSLIGTPVFEITPNKLIIRINYFRGHTKGDKIRGLIHKDLYKRQSAFFNLINSMMKNKDINSLKELLMFIKLSTSLKRWKRYVSLRYIVLNFLRKYALNLKINQNPSILALTKNNRSSIKSNKIHSSILRKNQSIILNKIKLLSDAQNLTSNIENNLSNNKISENTTTVSSAVKKLELINEFKKDKAFVKWENLHKNTNFFTQKWAIKKLLKLNKILKNIASFYFINILSL